MPLRPHMGHDERLLVHWSVEEGSLALLEGGRGSEMQPVEHPRLPTPLPPTSVASFVSEPSLILSVSQAYPRGLVKGHSVWATSRITRRPVRAYRELVSSP